MSGKVKEYKAESAYIILRQGRRGYDGLQDYLLGECVLYGIGTKADPIVAEQLLYYALWNYEFIIDDPSDPGTLDTMQNTEHSFEYLVKMHDEAEELLRIAEEMKAKMSDEEIAIEHNGMIDEEQIFDEWVKNEPLFIRRA